MTLVRIEKDWDWPDLLRQTPRQSGVWDGIHFTLDPITECDFLVVLNNRLEADIRVQCPENHVWALMQEPYEPGFTDWLVERHECFAKVLTHHVPKVNDRYVSCQPAIPWHVNKTFDELIHEPVPQKTADLSAIVGDAMDLPGHFRRRVFVDHVVRDGNTGLDLYGKAFRYIEDKWDALAPYKYSLAIENAVNSDLWTEKLADCFLSWTIPFYFGCPNIAAYFPEEAVVVIDIERPEESLQKMKQVMASGYWEKNLEALEAAREKILFEYQIFPLLSGLIKKRPNDQKPLADIVVPAYKRSLNARFRRILFKLKRRWRKMTRSNI